MRLSMDSTSAASDRAEEPARGTEARRPTEINALLGRGTRFEGKLLFEGRVRVDGDFTGEIRGDVLIVGDGATVRGDILVSTCIATGGEIFADVRARDGIELYAPSKVTGSLSSPAIFIDRGVKFEGTCKMAPLDDDRDVAPEDGDSAVVADS
jgi:cytoskeletal protein CcmA (bactofilin family)